MKTRFQTHRSSPSVEPGASSSRTRILRRTLNGLAAAVAAVLVAGCNPGPDTAAEGDDIAEDRYAQNQNDPAPGASTYGQTNRDQTATNMAGARGQERSSETQGPLLKQRIEEKLTDESNGATPTLTDQELQQVKITVNQGTVTLAGTVEDEQTKREVEQETKQVPGVEMVNNQLQIVSR